MEYRKQERKEGKTRSRSDRKKERCWEKRRRKRDGSCLDKESVRLR